MSAVAFDPTNSQKVWIGGLSGGLFRTSNYNSNGTGTTWSSINSPVSSAMISKILVRSENGKQAIYVSSFGGDIYWNLAGNLGLFKSTDDGATWTELSSSLSPCTSFWSFDPIYGTTNGLWGRMWGGGLQKLMW